MLLRLMISGYQPGQIISCLLNDKNDIFSIPRTIEGFYFWWLSEYVPDEIDKIANRPGEIDYLLNPYSIIDSDTSFKNKNTSVTYIDCMSLEYDKYHVIDI